MLPVFIALRIAPTGALCATSLRRIDWKRIGLRTWIAPTIHLIAGFQWIASSIPRAADGVITS
jgi:hypothetical protein